MVTSMRTLNAEASLHNGATASEAFETSGDVVARNCVTDAGTSSSSRVGKRALRRAAKRAENVAQVWTRVATIRQCRRRGSLGGFGRPGTRPRYAPARWATGE